MAPISINVLSTFLIVLYGSLPCRSHVCTSKTIMNCGIDNADSTTHCTDYNKTNLCLEELLQNCKDDTLINSIKSNIKLNELHKADCPGLPDGNCFIHEFYFNCETVKHRVTIPGQDKEKMAKECIAFSGKSSHMRTCLDNLKLKCVDNNAIFAILDEQFQRIDNAEKVCADLKKSSEH